MHDSLADVSDVIIEGNASIDQIKTTRPDEAPLRARGHRLIVKQAHIQDGRIIEIVGSPSEITENGRTIKVVPVPGHVEARGLSLDGQRIQLDQGINRLWIDGPGKMTLPMTRDLEGKVLTQPQPLLITWQGGLDFNGQAAKFRSGVLAKTKQQYLETELLTTFFSPIINFSKSDKKQLTGEPVEVRCEEGVYLRAETFAQEKPATKEHLDSITHLEARNLIINIPQGKMVAHGPGAMTMVRKAGGGTFPGMGTSNQSPAAVTQTEKDKLSYLQVRFVRSMDIDRKHQEAVFRDLIETTYGPVSDFNQSIDANRAEGLAPGELYLTCNEMVVRQMRSSYGNDRPIELEAWGNTKVEGSAFQAQGERMTYARAKDLLVLEGDGRRGAQLWYRDGSGSAPTGEARRIQYSPSTNKLVAKDFYYFEGGFK